MKYFITGATGFIGGRVARKLLDHKHEVIVLARNPAKAQALADLGMTIVQGDITDKDSMRDHMFGVDGVFHIAAWYDVKAKDQSMAYKINVEGTRNVLELMKELAIPKGVYTSTLAVFSDTKGQMVDENYRYSGRHLSEYDRTKAIAHYEVALPMMKAGLPLVTVLPGLVYGPGDTNVVHEALQDYLQRKMPMVPQKTAYCWGHVDDIVDGHILAMEKGTPGESYIIAGPPYGLADALRLAEEITGIPGPRIKVPPVMLKLTAAIMSVLERVVPVPPNYRSDYLRAIAGVTYWGTNEKARRELEYQPRPLEEGLRETLNYEIEQLGMKG